MFTKPEAAASYLSDLFHVDLDLDDGEWQSTEYFDIFQSQIFVDPNPPVVQLAADIEMYSVLLSQRRELERLRKERRELASSSATDSTEVQALRQALETSTTAQTSLLSDNDRLKAQLAAVCSRRDHADRRRFTDNDAKSTSEKAPLLPLSLSDERPGAFRTRQCHHRVETLDLDKECPLTDDLSTRASNQEHELTFLRRRLEILERERLAVSKRAVHHRVDDGSTVLEKQSNSYDELVSKQTNMLYSHSDHPLSEDSLTLRELKAQVLNLKRQLLGQAEPQDSIRIPAALSQDGHAQPEARTSVPDDTLDRNLAEALQREFLRERQSDFRDGRGDDDMIYQHQSQSKPTNAAHRQPDYLLAEALQKVHERQGLRLEVHNTARPFVRSHAEGPQKEPSDSERLVNIEKLELHQGINHQGEATRHADPVVVGVSRKGISNEQRLETRRSEVHERSQSSTDQIQPSASSSDPESEHRRVDGEHFPLRSRDATAVGTVVDRLPSQKQDFSWTTRVSEVELAAQDAVIALQIQGHYDLKHGKLASEREDLMVKILDHEELQPFIPPSHDTYAQYDMNDEDRETAERLQREYDEDDRRVAAITAQLNQEIAPQQIFTCVICMEVHSIENQAIVPHCDHITCRACLRAQIETTLQEDRYPVFCPCCDNESDKSSKFLRFSSLPH